MQINNFDIEKFSICLMNPPYGSAGGETIHLKFVNKVLDIADKQITIMPFNFVKKENRGYEKFKDKFSEYLIEIEEVAGDVFQSVNITNSNPAIYTFKNNKNSDKINIISKDDSYTITNVREISSKKFTDYEKKIIEYLDKYGAQPGCWAGGTGKRRQDVIGMSKSEEKEWEYNSARKNCKALKEYCEGHPDDHYILLANSHGAYPFAKYFSNLAGQIFDSYKETEQYLAELRKSSGFTTLIFNSHKAAENCKNAMLRPLLRLTLYRTQEDHALHYRKHFKYIPNIDWNDDRVKTDEGLLEVCGCPKDKCKEYTDYCKKIIDGVDGKK